jgi:hypothetical protein
MTGQRPTTDAPIDYMAVEAEARRLRAEALAGGVAAFWRWMTRRAPQGRTA